MRDAALARVEFGGGARRPFLLYTGLVLFSAFGTVASSRLGLDPGFVAPVAGALLVLLGAACVASEVASWRAAAAVLGLGLLVELAGLFTGVPFGDYRYTDAWWPTIPLGEFHRFPLLLPFAWLMIVGGSYAAVAARTRGWGRVAAAAGLATLVDWPMEQAMTAEFGYWEWASPGAPFGAPVTNVLGWLATSALAAWCLSRWGGDGTYRYAPMTLAAFCWFVGFAGSVSGWHPAWAALAIIGAAIAALSLVPSAAEVAA